MRLPKNTVQIAVIALVVVLLAPRIVPLVAAIPVVGPIVAGGSGGE